MLVRYTSRPVHELLPTDLLDQARIHRGDIGDPQAVRRAMEGADTVFHLAALVGIPYSYESPADVFRVNAQGSVNVLDRARELETPRLVLTSTSEVYGSARQIPMPLDHPLQAQSPYAASKIAADQMALSYHRSFGTPLSILRPFNTYGPGQSARAVIPTLLAQALRGGAIRLGTLDSTRDFTYVEDTVEAFLAAAGRQEALGRVTSCGTGRETSIGQLVELVGELTGKKLEVLSDPARLRPEASEVDRLCCDPESSARVLDWQPRVDIRQGLELTLEWTRQHLDEIGSGYQR